MVTLRLIRKYRKEDYTIGLLYVNGQYFCDTLEDTDRELDSSMTEKEIAARKVYGQTAIPYGRYRVTLEKSPKFSGRPWARAHGDGLIPRLHGVKGYSGVLIHVGNTADDSLGCLLIGRNTVKGKVTESTYWYGRLMDEYLLPAHARGEEITIEITR